MSDERTPRIMREGRTRRVISIVGWAIIAITLLVGMTIPFVNLFG